MKTNRIILLILFSVIFSISSLCGAEPELGRKIFDDGKYPQPIGNTGKISFLKYGHNENGRLQYEFVIADPKTGEVTPFDLELKEPPPYGSLVWSKDASKIAVVRKDLTVCDIYEYSATKPFKINKLTDLTPYVAALDSTYAEKHKLTPDMYLNVAWMDWSYDDSRIAFSMIGLQKSAVWVLDVATGKLRQITEEQFGASPCWSPDGKTIYMSGLGESSGKLSQDIYKMNMADYSLEPLINTQDTELYPDVTPDGKYLVYARMPDGGKQTIYVYDIENNKSVQLVYLGPNQSAAYPVWSSDGKSVFYQLIEPGNTYPDIYQIDFDPNIFN